MSKLPYVLCFADCMTAVQSVAKTMPVLSFLYCNVGQIDGQKGVLYGIRHAGFNGAPDQWLCEDGEFRAIADPRSHINPSHWPQEARTGSSMTIHHAPAPPKGLKRILGAISAIFA